ncbi:MAG: TerB family tellurite resistance protein [Bacteroidota bacterium]|nr:TerB family tellurite resistance protein [Bacteroidota bacterium]MDP4205331.1 TerB family tellurite resistance protein [Bacteroidota bacterium]
MGKFVKWIAGGLGWGIGGPIGGIIGFAIGALLEQQEISPTTYGGTQTSSGNFVMSLLVLVAAVMKADGKVMRSELEFVKNYFRQSFDEETAQEAIRILRDILQQDIQITDVCYQIKQNMDYSSRLQLLHFLYGIAQADGVIDPEEQRVIDFIAFNLGIHQPDIDSIRSMFVVSTDWAYNVLEIREDSTPEEIKKAYRKMALKYHPDKVIHLGEDFQNSAKEKFQKVSEAYETIKKEKNFV